uniref:Uncharacterized protein n=1 Tax=Tetradesmus obliquus TaxID=3088 RepID=A0A383V7C7_TETOB|eukprot:jgi/Sobl393_1/9302/SZX61495.1
MAADAGTPSANSTSSPAARLRISCSNSNLLATGSDGANSSSSSGNGGRYIVRGSPPVSPKHAPQHTRSLQSSGGSCMLFSLAMNNSDPGCQTPQNSNSSTAQPLIRAASLVQASYHSSSRSTDPGSRQQRSATSASCNATRFKLAPQGSGFGSQALKPAGNTGISSHSSCTAVTEHGAQKGRSQHTSYAGSSSSSSSSSRPAPGSLMAMSTLTEALQLCPFTGDASAGAMMLATAGFAQQDKRTQQQQQQPQTRCAGVYKQAGPTAVQQQIEWK